MTWWCCSILIHMLINHSTESSITNIIKCCWCPTTKDIAGAEDCYCGNVVVLIRLLVAATLIGFMEFIKVGIDYWLVVSLVCCCCRGWLLIFLLVFQWRWMIVWHERLVVEINDTSLKHHIVVVAWIFGLWRNYVSCCFWSTCWSICCSVLFDCSLLVHQIVRWCRQDATSLDAIHFVRRQHKAKLRGHPNHRTLNCSRWLFKKTALGHDVMT